MATLRKQQKPAAPKPPPVMGGGKATLANKMGQTTAIKASGAEASSASPRMYSSRNPVKGGTAKPSGGRVKFKQRIGTALTSDQIPASRTGSPQSGASHLSVTSPEMRSSAGIPKKTNTEPSRGSGVATVKNPGVHTPAGNGPDWKPPKTGTGNYGAAVSAAARSKGSGSDVTREPTAPVMQPRPITMRSSTPPPSRDGVMTRR